jgi:hypothetical protein
VIPAQIVLELPAPESPNKRGGHKMTVAKQRNAYKRAVWNAAVQQVIPFHDPPPYARVDVDLYLCGDRDEDNDWGSLKWLLDALKQRQRSTRFRQTHPQQGYFVDDDRDHIALVLDVPARVKENPRAVVTITPCEPGSVPTYRELEARLAA